ncbi:hypothetical protein JW879_07050 [candidate division WOR-3 bacterium]|nr:hypothetical protein [candidate division WOR-3 bacterium]
MKEVLEQISGAVSVSFSLKCLCVVLFICLLGVYGRKAVWLFKALVLDIREAFNYGLSGLSEVIAQDIINLLYVIVAFLGYAFGSRFGHLVFFIACIILLILGPLLVRLRQRYLSDRNYEFPAVKVISFGEDYRRRPQPVGVVFLIELIGLVGYTAGFILLRSI